MYGSSDVGLSGGVLSCQRMLAFLLYIEVRVVCVTFCTAVLLLPANIRFCVQSGVVVFVEL